MSYKLEKPYTTKQRADFIVEYNHNRGLIIEETDNALYALEPDEIMQDDKVIINPDYENQQLILAKQQRIAAIKQEFIEIDAKTIRPLRAGEQDKLDELEAQAEVLRQEMKALEMEEMGVLPLDD